MKCQVLSMRGVSADSLGNIDFPSLAAQTEGYVARDLHMVLQRAIHAHYVFNPNGKFYVKPG